MGQGEGNMRSDYILYAVAGILFIIAGISLATPMGEMERNLSVVSTAVLGLLFIGLGYSMKPRISATTIVRTTTPPPPPPPATSIVVQPPAPQVTEVAEEQKADIIVEAPPQTPTLEITQVKGIKAKRAEQLKALGISSVEDLANASAENLGTKLKISPKITIKWIESAKELLAKS